MRSLLLALLFPAALHAQAPGVEIVEQSRDGLQREKQAIADQVKKLAEAGELWALEEVKSALERPTPAEISLPSPRSKRLRASRIAKVAHSGSYRVGWGYLCEKCDHWHVDLAGGYAVSNDGILATCAHVVDPDGKAMREGSLIAVDADGKVHPVRGILANDEKMDAALISIGSKTKALPLNDKIRPGDAAFCLSRPLDQKDYFSRGMVNRFFWNSKKRGDDDSSLEALGHLKLNVSSRWAPGSSGSPVLDSYGNVIGHVAVIQAMTSGSKGENKGKNKGEPGGEKVMITLHVATPARAVRKLAGSGLTLE